MSKGDELQHTKRAYRNLFVKKTNPAGEHLVKHIEKLRNQALEKAEQSTSTDEITSCVKQARAYKIVLEHIRSMSKDPR